LSVEPSCMLVSLLRIVMNIACVAPVYWIQQLASYAVFRDLQVVVPSTYSELTSRHRLTLFCCQHDSLLTR
jgi:hypothetical protein